MFLEETGQWINNINRYGFIIPLKLNEGFLKEMTELSKNLNCQLKIQPDNHGQVVLPSSQFLSAALVRIDRVQYTVQEFILSLAYNGVIHPFPTAKKKEKYDTIYHRFLLEFPETVHRLIVQIACVLIDIFDELDKLLNGMTDSVSRVHKFQPIIVENGQLLGGTKYCNSLSQFSINAKRKKGIRICLEIKLDQLTQNNVLMEYGHPDNSRLKISHVQNGKFLFTRVLSDKNECEIRTDISDKLGKYFKLEIAVYPKGQVVLAIDEVSARVENLSKPVEIIDGKVVLGCDLEGFRFGEFYHRMTLVQSIDLKSETRTLRYFPSPFKKPPTLYEQILDYSLVRRRII